MGTIQAVNAKKDMITWDGSICEGYELSVKASTALIDAYIGCSIAVNGVCLTVTEMDSTSFTVGLAPETLRRTNLGLLSAGTPVNLERALRADSRNSGHNVQGHVDCTGAVLERWREGESLWMKIEIPTEYAPYIVPKGFICVDGTSLTVCDVGGSADGGQGGGSWFTYMLIAHTQNSVIQAKKAVGELVNVEVDVLGKTAVRALAAYTSRVTELEAEVLSLRARLDAMDRTLRSMAGDA